MHVSYEDILSRIPENPIWWAGAVPRYCPFEPHLLSVYADEAALIRIECQPGDVFLNIGIHGPSIYYPLGIRHEFWARGIIDVGDPPVTGDSRIILSHGVIEKELLELWIWEKGQWHREAALEGAILDENWNQVRPNYVFLAGETNREEWLQAVADRDTLTLRKMLENVGCEHAAEAARLVIVKSMRDKNAQAQGRFVLDDKAITEGEKTTE